MRFDIITLFPELFSALNYGIVGRALKQEIIHTHFWNPRHYTDDKQGRVDDRPYGGGPGMVMKVQPLRATIQAAKEASPLPATVIYLSPQGKILQQSDLEDFSQKKRLIFLAGRYEGIDERVIENDIDEEWSIGDYVLSGGEFAALVLIDGITRLLPDSIGDPDSLIAESFHNNLLDYPHYTRPEKIEGQTVPEILLSGNHQAIKAWREQQALRKTWLKRPDLLKNRSLNDKETVLLQQFSEHN